MPAFAKAKRIRTSERTMLSSSMRRPDMGHLSRVSDIVGSVVALEGGDNPLGTCKDVAIDLGNGVAVYFMIERGFLQGGGTFFVPQSRLSHDANGLTARISSEELAAKTPE